ncbi:MAG: hypothetical protein M3Q98_06170 [Actinomycetota bacterium]|nr:hypothetical protein [Actinomycetota bacterium]
MNAVLGIIFGGFVVAGVLAAARGVRLRTSDNKSLPVLMFVAAVPLIVFGVTGLATLITIAGRS